MKSVEENKQTTPEKTQKPKLSLLSLFSLSTILAIIFFGMMIFFIYQYYQLARQSKEALVEQSTSDEVQTPLSSYRTYNHSDSFNNYGFEFIYPDYLRIVTENNVNTLSPSDQIFAVSAESPAFSVKVAVTPEKNQAPYEEELSGLYKSQESVTVDGVSGTRFFEHLNPPSVGMTFASTILVNYENYTYIVGLEGDLSEQAREEEVISSFKFFSSKDEPMLPVAGKPVIYLYPIQRQEIAVKLKFNGALTDSYPEYDNSRGWRVIAFPDGRLVNQADGEEYSYLFWEGTMNDADFDLAKGFVVAGEETASFLQEKLSAIGLMPKEYNEFIVYWLPKMQHNKYNLIHFAQEEYTQNVNLEINPKPNSILRVFMVFKPLEKEISVEPQKLPPFNREGFTVVEWGATQLVD